MKNKTYLAIFIYLFALIGISLTTSLSVSADTANWLSTGATNNLINTSLAPGPMTGTGIECSKQSFQIKDRQDSLAITTETLTTSGCVMEGKNVSIAARLGGTGLACYYIKYKSDLYMYPFEMSTDIRDDPLACYDDVRLQLIPGTDTLIIEASQPGGWYVFGDLSQKLQVTHPLGQNYARTYTLNTSESHFRFAPADDAYAANAHMYQLGFGYSNSGRYIVFAARDADWTHSTKLRYFLYDRNTGSTKLFSVAEYDSGSFYRISFAVSDNGEYVTGGYKPEFSVWDIAGCGADIGTNLDTIVTDPCPSRKLGVQKSSSYWWLTDYDEQNSINYSTENFKFEAGNKEISFSYLVGPYQYKRIVIGAPGHSPDRLNYLALGDSYSSGEGDTYVDPRTNEKRYRANTNVEETTITPREKCHVSTQSYPYKIANSFSWNIASQNSIADRWQSVACSGAQKYDANEWNTAYYLGQGKGNAKQIFTNGSVPRLQGYANAAQLKVDALNEFIPGRQKQIEFVKEYKPKVVTLTMGGNDIGFGGYIGDCLKPTTCDKAKDSGPQELGAQIKKQFTQLAEFYAELKDASPGVRIYVLGYPQVITNDVNASCAANTSTLNEDERELIVAGYWYMNQVIAAAARSQSIHYVNTEGALIGHKLCESNPYVAGMATLGSSELQETFHPNADGHSLIANKFYEKLNYENPLEYSGYAADANPGVTETNIPHSDYLQTAMPPARNVEYKSMTNSEQIRSSQVNILVDPFTFNPGSTVYQSMRSDPIDLGAAIVASDGSLSVAPTIPSTVPPGYHTLIISGQTPSGEDIEYEQIILVKGEDPDDIDDNNVSDSQQACGPFIEISNEDEDYDGVDDACDTEVTEPILYIARNGDADKAEDPTKLYIYRNTRASTITGISNDYVDLSVNPDNTEALVAVSLDTLTSATYNRFIMLEDANDPNIKIPTILARDATNTCIALQPTDYLSPALNPIDPNYMPRGFTKLTYPPGGENCD